MCTNISQTFLSIVISLRRCSNTELCRIQENLPSNKLMAGSNSTVKKKLERKMFNVSLSPNSSLSFTLLSLPLMKGQHSNPNLNFALLFYVGNLTFAMINWFDSKILCFTFSPTQYLIYIFRNR